ncbi:MAG: DUF1549 domain-containing protein [Acidobacteria bacterium]|nr:DUF1549 domain-containing protein [Acidobacteriota bacterium]
MAIVVGVFSVMLSASRAQTSAVDFKRDIEPIFQANCYGCHSAKKASAQLRLDSKTAAMKGGLSGAVIVAGRSGESRLVQRLLGEGGDPRMPLGSQPLSGEQMQLIRKWIDEGAVWPDDAALKSETPAAVHWAFKAPSKAQLPHVQNRAWTKTPLDYFILEKLEKIKLAPSPEADKETLIRRLSLDLTGLPPAIREIDDFLADKSPGHIRNWSSGCYQALITANDGGAGGWMPRVMPIPTVLKKIFRGPSGHTATG